MNDSFSAATRADRVGLALLSTALLLACERKPEPASVAPPRSDASQASGTPANSEPANAAGPVLPAGVAAEVPAREPQSAGSLCRKLCDSSAQLRCKAADDCEHACRAMASGSSCQSELANFYRCLAAQPGSAWECVEDGSAAIREGFCETEQARFSSCLQEGHAP